MLPIKWSVCSKWGKFFVVTDIKPNVLLLVLRTVNLNTFLMALSQRSQRGYVLKELQQMIRTKLPWQPSGLQDRQPFRSHYQHRQIISSQIRLAYCHVLFSLPYTHISPVIPCQSLLPCSLPLSCHLPSPDRPAHLFPLFPSALQSINWDILTDFLPDCPLCLHLRVPAILPACLSLPAWSPACLSGFCLSVWPFLN